MRISLSDVGQRIRSILRALERNEPVTLLYRGRKTGVILPARHDSSRAGGVASHPAFGIWKDRADMADVGAFVRRLRDGRDHAV